jgi:phosphoglycerol transferase
LRQCSAFRTAAGSLRAHAWLRANVGPRKEFGMETGNRPANSWCRTVGLYALVAVVAVGLSAWVLGIGKLSLRIPFSYCGDTYPVLVWIKSVVDTGWWSPNPYLGTPGRMEMTDYPTNPSLHLIVFRVMAWFSHDPAILLNIYYLMSFPLVALAALAALRALGISNFFAAAASLLYTMAHYHFYRGEPHLFLSCYYMVPLVVLVIAWVWREAAFLVVRRHSGRLGLELKSRHALGSLLICVAVGLDSTYYPLFAAFFLLCAGLVVSFMKANRLTALRTLALVGVIGCVMVVNTSPTMLYQLKYGPNPSPLHNSNRDWVEVEMFSLKIMSMILPAQGHPLSGFQELRDRYYARTLVPSSSDSMSLGAVGTAGFLFLLIRLFMVTRPNTERGQLYALLSLLTVFAILAATTSGLITMVNLTVFPLARCFDRMSIFLLLFALAGLFAAFDSLRARYASSGWRAGLARGVVVCLVPLGVLDQAGSNYMPPQAPIKADYQNDREFIRRIEASVPPGTQVFQLPYCSFLGTNAAGRMDNYSHFRAYLHSTTLKWSFGAMHGRADDLVQAYAAVKPLPECLENLAYLGFAGIYVDRRGYLDDGAQVEAELHRLLKCEPLVSVNRQLAFYDLAPFVCTLRKRCTPEEWAAHAYAARYGPILCWLQGFYPEEEAGGCRWRWSQSEGNLRIVNQSCKAQPIRLKFVSKTYYSDEADLVITGPSFSDKLAVSSGGSAYERVVTIPPGNSEIQFLCNARAYQHPSRTIVFQLVDFQCDFAPAGER